MEGSDVKGFICYKGQTKVFTAVTAHKFDAITKMRTEK